MWQGGGVLFLSLKVSQYSIEGLPRFIGYDVVVLDTSDDSDRSAAAAADFDVCIEYSLEPLSSGHGCMALGGCADFCVGGELDAFPAHGWRDEPAPAVVRREYAVVAGEVDPRLRHQCRQSRYKIHGVKCNLRRSIAVGRLQCIKHLASGTE